jgi:hypothetical protein
MPGGHCLSYRQEHALPTAPEPRPAMDDQAACGAVIQRFHGGCQYVRSINPWLTSADAIQRLE